MDKDSTNIPERQKQLIQDSKIETLLQNGNQFEALSQYLNQYKDKGITFRLMVDNYPAKSISDFKEPINGEDPKSKKVAEPVNPNILKEIGENNELVLTKSEQINNETTSIEVPSKVPNLSPEKAMIERFAEERREQNTGISLNDFITYELEFLNRFDKAFQKEYKFIFGGLRKVLESFSEHESCVLNTFELLLLEKFEDVYIKGNLVVPTNEDRSHHANKMAEKIGKGNSDNIRTTYFERLESVLSDKYLNEKVEKAPLNDKTGKKRFEHLSKSIERIIAHLENSDSEKSQLLPEFQEYKQRIDSLLNPL